MAEPITMTTEEKAPLSVSPVTEAGNPATIDGAVTYTVTSGTCTIEPIDTLTAFVVSGPTPGDSTVEASADADLGAGVVTITDTITVHVTSPQAESLGLSAGTPVLK
jgi:hypothetical protein